MDVVNYYRRRMTSAKRFDDHRSRATAHLAMVHSETVPPKKEEITMIICDTASTIAAYISMYFDLVGNICDFHPRMGRTFSKVVDDAVCDITAAKAPDAWFSPETIEHDMACEIVLSLWTALAEQCSSGTRVIVADDMCRFIPDSEAECLCDRPLDIPDADQVRIAKHGLIRLVFELLQQRNVIPSDCSLK